MRNYHKVIGAVLGVALAAGGSFLLPMEFRTVESIGILVAVLAIAGVFVAPANDAANHRSI
jgi:phosphate/sulfate permease